MRDARLPTPDELDAFRRIVEEVPHGYFPAAEIDMLREYILRAEQQGAVLLSEPSDAEGDTIEDLMAGHSGTWRYM